MKTAMRAKDSARLSTIRLLLSGIKQREVDERKELTDADVVTVIEKMIKQRRESIAQYEQASRKDLADDLPQQMGDAEISQAVDAAIAEAKPGGIKDMGKVMAILKPRLAGKADMGKVSNLVKSKLSG